MVLLLFVSNFISFHYIKGPNHWLCIHYIKGPTIFLDIVLVLVLVLGRKKLSFLHSAALLFHTLFTLLFSSIHSFALSFFSIISWGSSSSSSSSLLLSYLYNLVLLPLFSFLFSLSSPSSFLSVMAPSVASFYTIRSNPLV